MPRNSGRRLRRWRSVCAIATLALAALSARESPAAGLPRLRVVVLPHFNYGVFYLTQELGYYAAQGLEVEFVKLERSTGALPLLLKGDLDVMSMAPAPALFHAVAQGERVRVVAGLSYLPPEGCASTGLVVRTGVELKPGLRGLRVSANRSLLAGYLLHQLLASEGLDADQQQFVDLGNSAELAAFLDGQLDAAVLGEPWRLMAEDAGAARMVRPTRDVLPGLTSSLVVFGPRLLDDRALGERFLAAHFQGVAAYREGPTPRNVGVLARALGVEPQYLERSCWNRISPMGQVPPGPLEAYQRWEVARGSQDRVVSASEYWDGGFVERAARSVGHRAR